MYWRTLLYVALIAAAVGIQYPLWGNNGVMLKKQAQEAELERIRKVNADIQARNAALQTEINELAKGGAAVEERARHDFGMVREGEVLFRFLDRQERKMLQPLPPKEIIVPVPATKKAQPSKPVRRATRSRKQNRR